MTTKSPALTPNDESELSLLSVLFFVYAAFVGMIALVVGAAVKARFGQPA